MQASPPERHSVCAKRKIRFTGHKSVMEEKVSTWSNPPAPAPGCDAKGPK